MCYDVLDVSKYVIKYSNEKKYGVSNLKLQKLLYFIQAYFLVYTKEKKRCFDESIEAWDFGPVVPEVYRQFKQYGSSNIPNVYLEFDEKCINENDKRTIESVVSDLSAYTATELVDITHNQEPWKAVYKRYKNNRITRKSIERYFNEK